MRMIHVVHMDTKVPRLSPRSRPESLATDSLAKCRAVPYFIRAQARTEFELRCYVYDRETVRAVESRAASMIPVNLMEMVPNCLHIARVTPHKHQV